MGEGKAEVAEKGEEAEPEYGSSSILFMLGGSDPRTKRMTGSYNVMG